MIKINHKLVKINFFLFLALVFVSLFNSHCIMAADKNGRNDSKWQEEIQRNMYVLERSLSAGNKPISSQALIPIKPTKSVQTANKSTSTQSVQTADKSTSTEDLNSSSSNGVLVLRAKRSRPRQ